MQNSDQTGMNVGRDVPASLNIDPADRSILRWHLVCSRLLSAGLICLSSWIILAIGTVTTAQAAPGAVLSLLPAVWQAEAAAATKNELWGDRFPTFSLSFPKSISNRPYTGRVYLFFARTTTKEPRLGPNWFNPDPFVALDVQDWLPDTPLKITGTQRDLICFPAPPAQWPREIDRVQAVIRFNPLVRQVGNGAGNGYSAARNMTSPLAVPADKNAEKQSTTEKRETSSAEKNGSLAEISLTVDQLQPEPEFRESEWSKLLVVPSRLLSEFHHRDEATRGAVILPASYHQQPDRRYPVIVTVTGFGGSHFMGQRNEPIAEKNPGDVEFIRVIVDANCALGHHVFADSANNGPVGTALVEEFLPALDQKFRTTGPARGRFVTGHSSGGWSSLWLQVTYPDSFHGVWSTAPDPVDFRDFQQIDLYQPGSNMYRDERGQPRPIARRGQQPVLFYERFDLMETVLGPGGQLHSFEAVFSPRGSDGRPLRAWDRRSGQVHLDVTRSWEKYDIRLVLERNWPQLKDKLAGKLHLFMGEADTFYLEGATRRLKQTLQELKSDAVVEMVPDKDHGSLLTPELMQRIRTEMAETFLRSQK